MLGFHGDGHVMILGDDGLGEDGMHMNMRCRMLMMVNLLFLRVNLVEMGNMGRWQFDLGHVNVIALGDHGLVGLGGLRDLEFYVSMTVSMADFVGCVNMADSVIDVVSSFSARTSQSYDR